MRNPFGTRPLLPLSAVRAGDATVLKPETPPSILRGGANHNRDRDPGAKVMRVAGRERKIAEDR